MFSTDRQIESTARWMVDALVQAALQDADADADADAAAAAAAARRRTLGPESV